MSGWGSTIWRRSVKLNCCLPGTKYLFRCAGAYRGLGQNWQAGRRCSLAVSPNSLDSLTGLAEL